MTALALAMITASIFPIIAVQLCTSVVRRWSGPTIAYACWLLPWLGVIASMLPVRTASAILGGPAALTGLLSASAVARADRLLHGPACQFGLVAWGSIAILFLAAHLAAYRAFVRNSARGAVEHSRAGTLRIFSGPNVSAPVAAGIFRPRIFLPANFETAFSTDEQRMILRHEQAHHDRHDLAANLAGLLLLSLHWWNPIAYRAHRRFRADQELACDATALAGLGPAERYAYGMAILKCSGRPHAGLGAAVGLLPIVGICPCVTSRCT